MTATKKDEADVDIEVDFEDDEDDDYDDEKDAKKIDNDDLGLIIKTLQMMMTLTYCLLGQTY